MYRYKILCSRASKLIDFIQKRVLIMPIVNHSSRFDEAVPSKVAKPDVHLRPPVIKFVKLSKNALKPTRGSTRAAGYDLYSAEACTIPGQGKAIVKTDLSIRVPEGTYGRIAPRSGLAAKRHIDIGAGVVDEDYTGPVGVVMFNHAQEAFEVNQGDRIAQLICERIVYPDLEEVDQLEDTDRGAGGFGSTGKA